ncbi:hypothetical protein VNO78_03823 [Psophocarpus tetragonolobus]|uniref:Uncharacterized protein n=1 Tax=Psophocarpus tetragonolobus TaxID=3891 RepID=A0AAN9XX18_PSOTE
MLGGCRRYLMDKEMQNWNSDEARAGMRFTGEAFRPGCEMADRERDGSAYGNQRLDEGELKKDSVVFEHQKPSWFYTLNGMVKESEEDRVHRPTDNTEGRLLSKEPRRVWDLGQSESNIIKGRPAWDSSSKATWVPNKKDVEVPYSRE